MGLVPWKKVARYNFRYFLLNSSLKPHYVTFFHENIIFILMYIRVMGNSLLEKNDS